MTIDFLDAELRPARHLIVAFAGVHHGLGAVPFEFHRSLTNVDCSPLFVRDLGQRWYQYPLADINAAIGRINKAKTETGARHLTMLGNSMGGFGALLFGSFCSADAMLAFVPQTAIDPAVLHGFGDNRWDEWAARIPAFPMGDLLAIAPARGRSMICIGDDEPLDRVHADRLVPLWRCEATVVEGAAHNAAGALRERGELLPLIERVVGWSEAA